MLNSAIGRPPKVVPRVGKLPDSTVVEVESDRVSKTFFVFVEGHVLTEHAPSFEFARPIQHSVLHAFWDCLHLACVHLEHERDAVCKHWVHPRPEILKWSRFVERV